MKTVLILGANSDVAAASVPFLLKNGYHVILAGRRLDELEHLANANEQVSAVYFDAMKLDNHQQFYKGLNQSPDIVLYAAGILDNDTVLHQDSNQLEHIVISNYLGAISILNIVAADFKAKKTGVIMAISSVAADRGRGTNLLYCSTKAGLDSYLSGLRNYLHKDNVRVVTIRPGFIKSKMLGELQTPNWLTATPEQVANTIVRAMNSTRNIIYVKGVWRLIMLVIKMIPEPLFKRMKL